MLSTRPLTCSADHRKPGQVYGGLSLDLLPPPAPRMVPLPCGRVAQPSPWFCTTFQGLRRDKGQTEHKGWKRFLQE